MPKKSPTVPDASESSDTGGAAAPVVVESKVTADSTADVEKIAADLASSMPEVQDHAVAQAVVEQQAAQNATTDKEGKPFDSAIHTVGADGKGVFTVRGTWAQKRGRKAGAPATPTVARSSMNSASVVPSAQIAQQQQEAQSRAAGVAAAELLFMCGKMIGGEEWEPMQNKTIGMDERTMMHGAFGDYFIASGVKDIPPGAALTFCIIAYVAPRFAMPKTQTRYQKVKGAVTTWWINRKLRKEGSDVQVQAKPV